ncbi:hypothetical protein SNE40_023441 [Patella caerulea]|uniref:OTU domain-containing protein n=1 Tax=Patella caerulea TaxID=87958 RepID=A0AAN8GC25_PATCE
MVRVYYRKRPERTAPDVLQRALEHFKSTSDGYKKTAALFNIPASTLHGYINKYKKLDQAELSTPKMSFGYTKPRQVFTDEQEKQLATYLQHAASIYFGLSPREVRMLAYECAKLFNLQMPVSWSDVQMAGPDWFSAFLKRHPQLAIRVPEATSLARASAFNKANVSVFFGKLAAVMDRNKFDCTRIWNIDETAITTVVKPNKVVASTGTKQVGSLTSQERGQLVTLCAAVSAAGQAIPPFLVFPRVNFKSYFLNGAPPGADGSAHPSGWMTHENFLLFLKHFVSIVQPSNQKPVLLLLDNHQSHLAIEVLDFAKQNGIVMLSFPPHCSHRLQPLDISVFGPLKKKVSQAQSNWLRNHPGKPIGIYDIASILCEPWKLSMTMTNICSGFRKSGIYPYNCDIFSDSEYMPSDVTDRQQEPASVVPDDHRPCGPDQDQNRSSNESVVQSSDSPDLTSYLDRKSICRIPVGSDGHCLLYSVCSSLAATNQGAYTSVELAQFITKEVEENQAYYKNFVVTEDAPLPATVQAYLVNKEFNNNTCDLILNSLCNAMNMKALVIRETGGAISELEVMPGRQGVQIQRTIYLVLQGSGGGAHYNGAICSKTHPSTVESLSNRSLERPLSPNTFSPEIVKPHPKAPQRSTKACVVNRKRRKSCILTDTPEKEALREEQDRRISKKLKQKVTVPKKLQLERTQRIEQNKQTGVGVKRKSRNQGSEDSDSEEIESFCLLCMEPWSNSRSREKWIQCVSCKLWSHEECADTYGKATYVCLNCDSDDEIS